MLYGKIVEEGYLFLEDIKEGEKPSAGCKPVDDIDESKLVQVDEVTRIEATPFEKGERISFRYIPRIDERLYFQKVAQLTKKLEEDDYKIIKCYESNLVGEKMPYDIAELHEKREKIRNSIRKLEKIKKQWTGN